MKPSERISQLADDRYQTVVRGSNQDYVDRHGREIREMCTVRALIAYLDEQHAGPHPLLTPLTREDEELVGAGKVVTYWACRICGYRQWAATMNGEPGSAGSVRLEWFDAQFWNGCPNCQEAHHRAPEVVRWVVGVVAMLKAGEVPEAPP